MRTKAFVEVQINRYIEFNFKCCIMTWKTQCISLNGMSVSVEKFQMAKFSCWHQVAGFSKGLKLLSAECCWTLGLESECTLKNLVMSSLKILAFIVQDVWIKVFTFPYWMRIYILWFWRGTKGKVTSKNSLCLCSL